jgi:hypothetical protein
MNRSQNSPRSFVATGMLLLWATTVSAGTFDFDDLEFIVGEGNQIAGLVIDWNDGQEPQSLAWGFRWDGTATGEDLLTAVINADERLYGKLSEPGDFGRIVYGLGYDLNNNGFGLDDGTVFEDGLAIVPGPTKALPTDPFDHYEEGFFSRGFWGYYTADGPAFDEDSWSFAPVGFSDRELVDGQWDGWSWAPDFADSVPSLPVAAVVPAPGSILLLLGVVGRRRR